MTRLHSVAFVALELALLFCNSAVAFQSEAGLEKQFESQVVPLLQKYCAECHGKDLAEAEIDYSVFPNLSTARKDNGVWQRAADAVNSRQMPPKDARQLTDAEHEQLQKFLTSFLTSEAKRLAGDPGPIVLRRLSNAEYTNSIRAITSVPSLDPAHEFPVDGASGEGFTNAGNALVMSPSLITKYLDAGKDIAQHAVLLPDGIRFSASVSRRDWTEESLADIRNLYAKYTASEGGTQVNLQGIVFNTNGGGRLPIENYLRVTIKHRQELKSGARTFEQLSKENGLSPKYLRLLWTALNKPESQLVAQLATQWENAQPNDLPKLMEYIHNWQKSLWKFNSVGHIGKVNGPKSWMEAISPIATIQDFRVAMPKPADGTDEVTIYLVTGDAGDGSKGDLVIWQQPRLVAAGRSDLLLKDVRRVSQSLKESNAKHLQSAERALRAADSLMKNSNVQLTELAKQYEVEQVILEGWLEYLGIKSGQQFQIQGHLSKTITSASGYDFVKGWVGDNALGVMANSSDNHVRVPGNMYPHSIAVHPAPNVQAVIGWASPITSKVNVSGHVRHAHPECGNGVVWALQLRRGSTVQTLANGVAHGDHINPIQVASSIAVTPTDVLCLVIGPRDGNHSCDLTNVQLVIEPTAESTVAGKKWDLSADLSGNLLEGNPHADSNGNQRVWHMFGEPVSGPSGPVIPAGSLLAKWQANGESSERAEIAQSLAKLLKSSPAELATSPAPDLTLIQQLRSLGGPLMSNALKRLTKDSSVGVGESSSFGLPASDFGVRPDKQGSADADSLYVQSPAVVAVKLPASLVEGTELVTSAMIVDGQSSDLQKLGSVQVSITAQPPQSTGLVASPTRENANAGAWTSSGTTTSSLQPVVVSKDGSAKNQFEKSFQDFRSLFPAALCYNKIVPVDEVVTLTLYYREDQPLQDLMLSESEIATLQRYWDELHFVSRDALALVDAYEQLWQYATQDADPSAFEPLRAPIMNRAVEFREQLKNSQPKHLAAVIRLANNALRRPLGSAEQAELERLYNHLLSSEVPHELAIQSLIARILVSPAFLYRLETGVGELRSLSEGEVKYRRLSDHELATRLSYFLTSSPPDAQLREAADASSLSSASNLNRQVDRVSASTSIRNFATEFGCQWLHIYDFAAHDEKSEQAFPSFNALRAAMYEESILFWTDIVQNNGSILTLLKSDNIFINQALADHYGIDVQQASMQGKLTKLENGWMKIGNASRFGRDGGMLSMASILSKQSGASRTSPILRGNWVCEILLGDKLPKPPPGVPQLPETPPEGLTERQLIELHSRDPDCAKCHVRIDPIGYALEGYDAIGRRRDPAKYDTKTTLADGTHVSGMTGLRDYLLAQKRDHFVRQFCKKLLGYSLGRAVQLSDQPLLEEMFQALQSNDFKIRSAIDVIVNSKQFRVFESKINWHTDLSLEV
ncbi:MAG: DUF1592 domain-containing protein [Pirellulales bacterium]